MCSDPRRGKANKRTHKFRNKWCIFKNKQKCWIQTWARGAAWWDEDGGGGGNDGARGCCWWVTVARTTVTVALPHRATVAIKLTRRERAHTHRGSALRWEEIRPHAFMGNKDRCVCECERVCDSNPPSIIYFYYARGSVWVGDGAFV